MRRCSSSRPASSRSTIPIGKHLPDYPNHEVAAKVTLRHLLTHTGGTGDIFGPVFEQNRLQLRRARRLREALRLEPLLGFEPGARFEYSNYGFVLLGAVIEAASGQSYYDYAREHVFRPAGMTATGPAAGIHGCPETGDGVYAVRPRRALGAEHRHAAVAGDGGRRRLLNRRAT